VSARAVLFDAAGTLIELREPIGETYARFARARGVEISAWRLEDAFSRVREATPPLLFPGVPATEVAAHERAAWRDIVRQTFLAADSAVRVRDFDACFDALFRHLGSGAGWRPCAGAETALPALRRAGFATAVVSNFDRRLPAILADLGLRRHLDLVLLASDVGAAKPDPRIFAEALRRLGVAAADATFVGDDARRDLEGARAAGLRAVDAKSLATLAQLPDQLARLFGDREPTSEGGPAR
jgi:putative hydrolase of the HAD superfamily